MSILIKSTLLLNSIEVDSHYVGPYSDLAAARKEITRRGQALIIQAASEGIVCRYHVERPIDLNSRVVDVFEHETLTFRHIFQIDEVTDVLEAFRDTPHFDMGRL